MKQFGVSGMSCAACAARIEKAVGKVEGVTACSVSLLTNSMGVEGTAEANSIIAAVTGAGYGCAEKGGRAADGGAGAKPSEADALRDTETPILKRRLLASVGFLAALMYVSMGHGMLGWPVPAAIGNPVAVGLAQMLLAAITMIINRSFFVSGFKSLMGRAPNMDTLIALGSAAAFVYSTAVLFALTAAVDAGDAQRIAGYSHGFYFEAAAMILTLITVGKLLEARSKGRTTDALRSLMNLAPRTAVVIRDGVEAEIPVENVKKGDIFAVRPGENIPVDGEVIEGHSAVNEAALSGESIPVDKAAGDAVSAATLNQSGYIRCRATRVGEDTTLSKIIKLVSDAAATKAPIAKIADRVSGVFVPAVICIAVAVTALWLLLGRDAGFALGRGISVLVISCPCALGLATPVAIMVGSGMGAKRGVLFKTAASIEAAGRVNIVALDKTGTVTTGEPKVTDIIPAEGVGADELLGAAYALELKSEHPLAKAILGRAEEEGIAAIDVTEFEALPGNGLTATLGGSKLAGGSYGFISTVSAIAPEVAARGEELARQGKTPLFFSRDGALMGVIAVADAIREDSARAVLEMRSMGIHVVMLTGDNERTAGAIGAQAGVDEVIAGVLPDGKESVIRDLKTRGRVAMVGDGINDAPALTRADTGIAIGAGADVAIDAADVVLMKSRLSDAVAAIRLGRATLRCIRENLFWAFFYNAVCIPVAAGAFVSVGLTLNPMIAAGAMSLSSITVVMNALRLNFFDMTGERRRGSLRAEVPQPPKPAEKLTKTVAITGMMCEHCEKAVKNALEAMDGVAEAEVSHGAGTARVTLRADVPDELLKKAVESAGYDVTGIV